MDKKSNPSNKFLKSSCIESLNNLVKFYENSSYLHVNDDLKEYSLIRIAINECTKSKCPPGQYNLNGECLDG